LAEDQDNEDKSEEPSQHRLEKSREQGDVAISKEISVVLVLAAAFIAVILSGQYMFETLMSFIDELYKMSLAEIFTQKGILDLLVICITTILKTISPVFAVSFIIGIAVTLMQVGLVYAPDLIQPKLDRINPMGGLKRLFSTKALFELGKGLIKFTAVSLVTYHYLDDFLGQITGFFYVEISSLLHIASAITIKIVFAILFALFIISVMDFMYEKFTYHQRMRMTKKEVKDEVKEREGNPEIRSKIKSMQRELAKKRMMKEVVKADVIVTNPTHLSVALKYDKQKMVAPLVVAKGADLIALKIREIAKGANIPIVENITVARALYQNVKIGDPIPKTLYSTVAEILGFVYRLKKKSKAVSLE
jgi:flagellar biosynthetic protein FlhB